MTSVTSIHIINLQATLIFSGFLLDGNQFLMGLHLNEAGQRSILASGLMSYESVLRLLKYRLINPSCQMYYWQIIQDCQWAQMGWGRGPHSSVTVKCHGTILSYFTLSCISKPFPTKLCNHFGTFSGERVLKLRFPARHLNSSIF